MTTIRRLLRALFAPSDASGCVCHLRARWATRKGRPGFRPSEWDR